MDKVSLAMQQHGFRHHYLRRDPNTGTHFATISFPTGGGSRDRIEVPASMLAARRELQRLLRDRDATLPSSERHAGDLLSALARATPERRQRYASTYGWSRDKTWFVMGKTVIGAAPHGQLGVRPAAHTAGEGGQLRQRGTARQWRNTVGRLALSSSVGTLAICIALASPLLAFTNRPSFGICLCGKSRRGKTLACLCGASMIGIGRDDELISWRSSATSIEERLTEFVDIVFVLEDVSAMDEPEPEQYPRLRNFSYMLATNQGKGRARLYKGSTGTTHARHRTIVLTSSERSIAALAARSRRQRLHGEALRLIDLPAIEDTQDDIFDRTTRTADRAEFIRQRRQLIGDIIAACRRYHGTAYIVYIKRLIKHRRKLAARVNKLIATFARHVEHDLDGPEARDLAEKFGLLFAGGMLGLQLNCVPWTKTDVRSAITTCYFRALSMITDDAQLLKSGIAILHTGLKRLPRYRPNKKGQQKIGDADGYSERRFGVTSFIIRTEALNQMLPNGQQRELVKQWLLEQGALTMARTRSASKESTDRPKSQFTWPDGQRHQSLKITWPPQASSVTNSRNQ